MTYRRGCERPQHAGERIYIGRRFESDTEWLESCSSFTKMTAAAKAKHATKTKRELSPDSVVKDSLTTESDG